MKEFCHKLKKRICLHKSCAEWLDHLKAVRRALRDGSFCQWTPATNIRQQPAQQQRCQQHEAPKRKLPQSIVVAQASKTHKSTNSIDNKDKDANDNNPIKPRQRQDRKCKGCGAILETAPRGTTVAEIKERWHTKFGWCPKLQGFVKNSTCSCCGKARSHDIENHLPNGYCCRAERFPGR